jgi:hypothetical protein
VSREYWRFSSWGLFLCVCGSVNTPLNSPYRRSDSAVCLLRIFLSGFILDGLDESDQQSPLLLFQPSWVS